MAACLDGLEMVPFADLRVLRGGEKEGKEACLNGLDTDWRVFLKMLPAALALPPPAATPAATPVATEGSLSSSEEP